MIMRFYLEGNSESIAYINQPGIFFPACTSKRPPLLGSFLSSAIDFCKSSVRST
jgi:hypothetical protein